MPHLSVELLAQASAMARGAKIRSNEACLRRSISTSYYAPFTASLAPHSNDLRTVAKNFTELQEHRHRADYDLQTVYTRIDAIRMVGLAEDAVAAWNRIKRADRSVAKLFAVMLLQGESFHKRV
jgi:uncharacterized protein (UPF0332 family)